MNIISPETVDNVRQEFFQNFCEIIYRELNKALLISYKIHVKISEISDIPGPYRLHGSINLPLVIKQIKSELIECGFIVERFSLYWIENDFYMSSVIKTPKEIEDLKEVEDTQDTQDTQDSL